MALAAIEEISYFLNVPFLNFLKTYFHKSILQGILFYFFISKLKLWSDPINHVEITQSQGNLLTIILAVFFVYSSHSFFNFMQMVWNITKNLTMWKLFFWILFFQKRKFAYFMLTAAVMLLTMMTLSQSGRKTTLDTKLNGREG